ncbi:hypothetical protein KGF54_004822 [Candida jiufengensis]|uniref:uncharacterized protein n=1 Tax=Candida jiufengensis TaxID=497108 RepID=UPI002224F403|nr:uncharacterized protein KGF54_004822 [Candida jiufengensis]KAI5951747.1 hypothetical protein KGF54_004822 [Candida jiufengensis]
MSSSVEQNETTIFVEPVKVHSSKVVTNDKEANHLLREAQANLEFSADTGYAPELKRNFSLISIMGLGMTISNAWLAVSASLIATIVAGGPMMIIYGTIIMFAFAICIAITLGELSSAYPNASGQIYWTMKLTPAKYNKFLSYATGWLAWSGSLFTSASVTVGASSAVVGMYMLYHPDKSVQTWHVFLTYELLNIAIMIFNVYEKPLPYLSKATLVCSISSFIIIIIVVLAMHRGEFETAKFVFVEFNNQTGWSSDAIAFLTAMMNVNWGFSCLDSATHLAEESLNPAVQIPQAIVATVVVGFLTSMPFAIAVFYCIRNLDAIYSSTTGAPIMDIFYQATESKAAAVGLEFLIFITLVGCNIGCHTWSARLAWSFSRDKGLPWSQFWSVVHPKTKTPVNAHIMNCFWVGVIGCLYMASTTAYTALIVSCITFVYISYLPSVIMFIIKRNQIKPGPFFLGKIGLVCNLVLVFWVLYSVIFYSFPFGMPVLAGNMNYSSAVLGIAIVLLILDWNFRAKKNYIGFLEREQMKELYTEY